MRANGPRATVESIMHTTKLTADRYPFVRFLSSVWEGSYAVDMALGFYISQCNGIMRCGCRILLFWLPLDYDDSLAMAT